MSSGRVPTVLAIAALVGGGAGCGRTALDRPALDRPPAPAPEPLEPPPPLARFAVIGDYGRDSAAEARVARMVASWNPDFVITTGDNNYPSGGADTIDANIGKHYARFIGQYTGAYGPGSAVTRFWPSPGNHDWGAGNLAAYLDYFTLPGNERYYDVTIGPVHLFALDSDAQEPDGNSEGSTQAHWLEAVLSSSTACFDVVYFHHAAYSSGPHGSVLNMRWPFEAWGADIVFAGHDHIYERTRVGGIRHVTVGVSGNDTYPFVDQIADSEARFTGQNGALLATVREDGLTIQFFAADGRQIDTFKVHKPCR